MTLTAEMGTEYVTGALFLFLLTAVIPMIIMMWEDHQHRTRALKNIALSKGVVKLSGHAAITEAVEVLVASWAGSEPHSAEPEMLHAWMLSPKSGDRALLRWMAKFYLAFVRVCPGSVVLGVRGVDGTLSAVAAVVPYLDGLPEMRSQTDMSPLRGPIVGMLVRATRVARARAMLGFGSLPSGAVKQRFDAACAVRASAHRKACPSARPHLHVGLLAVKPATQGTRHASALLKHINTCAEELHCACYLDCSGKRAKDMFTRFGYRTLGDFPLSVGATPTTAKEGFGGVWAMERPLQREQLDAGEYCWDFIHDEPSFLRSKPAHMKSSKEKPNW